MLPVARKVLKHSAMKKSRNKSRRKFFKDLSYGLAVLLGGYLLWILFNFYFFNPISDTAVIGKYSQFQLNHVVHNERNRIFLVRDTAGLYAVSDVCTHRECMLNNRNGKLECPCHEGAFSLLGQPVSGPVEVPLDHYYIYKNKQNKLVVDVSRVVQKEFRFRD